MSGWPELSDDTAATVVEALSTLDVAINRGDFAYAHRVLVILEKIATGKLPDRKRLCEPRS